MAVIFSRGVERSGITYRTPIERKGRVDGNSALSLPALRADTLRIGVLGLAFKENCADVRNTRVIEIARELETYGVQLNVHVPWVDPVTARDELGIDLVPQPDERAYDGLILAVAHQQFRDAGNAGDILAWGKADAVVYDVGGSLDRTRVDGRL